LPGAGHRTVGPQMTGLGTETCSCCPGGPAPQLEAEQESVLYWCMDAPLLPFLGRPPGPSLSPRAVCEATHLPGAGCARNAALARRFPAVPAATGSPAVGQPRICPQGARHDPHAPGPYARPGAGRRLIQARPSDQSWPLDLVIDCQPGGVTISGPELNCDGRSRVRLSIVRLASRCGTL